MGFNLEDYEDVHSRKLRFKALYPTSRILTDVLFHDFKSGHILIATRLYLRYEDEQPSAIDIAFGDRDTFPANIRKFYVETTSTSSQGRAYDLVLETTAKPTREDMERVESADRFSKRVESFKSNKVEVENPKDPWTIEAKEMPLPVAEAVVALNDGLVPEQIPTCPIHKKPMQPREGVSKNKPWKHYKCNPWPDACEQIVWMEIDKTGQWVPQRPRYQQGAMN